MNKEQIQSSFRFSVLLIKPVFSVGTRRVPQNASQKVNIWPKLYI